MTVGKMRYAVTLVILVAVFHLPVWKWGYRNHKYRFTTSMPGWMLIALNVRNRFESDYGLEGFYWLKLGRFYIRKNYSMPGSPGSHVSRSHLFVVKKIYA